MSCPTANAAVLTWRSRLYTTPLVNRLPVAVRPRQGRTSNPGM
jgi:hypothetical protein